MKNTPRYGFDLTDEEANLVADALNVINPDTECGEKLAHILVQYFRGFREVL